MVTGCSPPLASLALPIALLAALAALATVCCSRVDEAEAEVPLLAPLAPAMPWRHEGLPPLVVPIPLGDDSDAGAAVVSTSTASSVAAVRAERSANLSHIAGAGRKIMMYVRNRHLQILPDGTVNGTDHEGSDYAVLQRTSVNKVQVKMQGIATCLFLCMDACGLLYGSKELTDDCVFNELLEQHYYNTYSSAKYSSAHRSLYLALDRRGASRRVQIRRDERGDFPQGRLAAYTRVLTKPVAAERVVDLLARLRVPGVSGASGPTHFRHRGHHAACPPHGHPEPTLRRPRRCPRPGSGVGAARGHKYPTARRRAPGAASATPRGSAAPADPVAVATPEPAVEASAATFNPRPSRRKCEATEDEDLCHKRLAMIAAKKRKSRNEKKHGVLVKRIKVVKKGPPTSTLASVTLPPTLPPLSTQDFAGLVPLHPGLILRTQPAAKPRMPGAALESDTLEDEDQDEDEDSVTATTEMMTTTAAASPDDAAASASLAQADDP